MRRRAQKNRQPYEDVWPSTRIEDAERSNLQQRGELIVHYGVEIGDIIMALDDLGIELEDARFDVVSAVGGLAVRVRIEK